ncbi:hypothetical protein KEA58_05290, partial [Treponema pallidum]
MGVDVRTYM